MEPAPNDINWELCQQVWHTSQSEQQPHYGIGSLILNHPLIAAAPALDLVSDEYSMFCNRQQRPINIADYTPYQIDAALIQEVAAQPDRWFSCVGPSANQEPGWDTSTPSAFYASLALNGSQESVLQPSPPTILHNLLSVPVTASHADRGLARLGLRPLMQPSERECQFHTDPSGKTPYSLTWSPAGSWTDVHIDDSGLGAIVLGLRGCKIWITWPATAANRDAYHTMALESKVLRPSCIALLGVLEGLRVACILPGQALRVMPGMFHCVLTMEPSAHLSVGLVYADEWDLCAQGMRWEIAYSRMAYQAGLVEWTGTHAHRAKTEAYIVWREFFVRLEGREDGEDWVEKRKVFDSMVKSSQQRS